MGRTDRRAQSIVDQQDTDERSREGMDPRADQDRNDEGQTRGGAERGPEPGQYTDAGSPGQIKR